EGLRGTRLLAPALATEPDEADEDAFYEDDLIGLEARDPVGVVVGTVSGLEIGGAQDRLVLTLNDGVTAYVPFVRQFVPTVAGDHVVVDAPVGLYDLYREGLE
ncbi:MAG: ribosome maturation factor RimM, partial [Terracoccus sp.]